LTACGIARVGVLPAQARISAAEAGAHKKAAERWDGLDLTSGARFVGSARRHLTKVDFKYAQGFDLVEWPSVWRITGPVIRNAKGDRWRMRLQDL
jgi:hypothetical protein